MGLFDIFFKKQKVEEKVETNVQQTEEKKVETKQTEQPTIPLSTNQTVISPTSFDELQSIIFQMRDNNTPALINLSGLDVKTAQRYVDVLSGAVVALYGSVVKIQQNVYYFCPKKP